MLLDDLVGVIETLKGRVATHGASLRENEIRTRMALIDPLLQALGWDVSNPEMVTPEYSVGASRADYALLTSTGNPSALVEAKKLDESLASHRMQMLNYANAAGIPHAGLTDGNHWEMYTVFDQAPIEQRGILDVSIADTPAHEAALKLLLLWRPNLASGKPVEANSPISGLVEGPLGELSDRSTLDTGRGVDTGRLISLAMFKPNPGDKPPTVMQFPDGEQRSIATWRDVLIQPAEWLVATGRLNSSDFPLSDANGMSFINSSPHSPGGTEFRTFREISGGVFLNVNWTNFNMVKRTINLVRRFGVSPESVELRFE